MVHTLKNTGQIGLAALHVLECAYEARFKELGIHDEMDAIAATELL
jgi:hypothetical protein